MHIPDNYLSPQTCAAFGAVMVPVWAIAIKKVRQEISREKIPLLGIGAAFAFLIMMFNVPLPGGTSGHAVGGTLIALLLGPWSACISISVALFIQALLFGDGGILSFAANCFNMAFVLPMIGWTIARFLLQHFKSFRGRTASLAFASWAAITVSALVTAIEFGIQPLLFTDSSNHPLYCPYPLSISIPAMLIPHMLVAGVVEALFTVTIFHFLSRVSPESPPQVKQTAGKAFAGVLAILIGLSPLGLLATGTAWGEWGGAEIAQVSQGGQILGFVPSGMQNGFSLAGLIPDYSIAGMPAILAYLISALSGTAILVIIFKLFGLLKFKKSTKAIGQ